MSAVGDKVATGALPLRRAAYHPLRLLRVARLILLHLLLIIAALVVIFPVYYAIVVSTHTFQEVFSYPPKLLPGDALLANYAAAWRKVGMGRLLLNSTGISLLVPLGKIVFSVLAAFAFTYFRGFRARGFFFVLILITHMLPLPVRIVPTYQLMQRLGWINTYTALTVPFFASATGTLLFRQFFLTVPASLSEAARIDGAGPLRFLLQILLPLSRNNLAALFMVEFVYMWNQYLWPLIVTTSHEMRVVQIGIKMLVATDAQAEWNVIMAGVMMAMLPPLVVLLLLQRSFVQSISLGQEK
ncbi:MAG: ABC transporter permease subunit [Armatimonadota bacterium]|nr:ABC transporter permease subunit [Armatimonadota bacterium]MDR7469296.1 ABC transporter permease subunit [Armatimonadota bacterium]MDR7475639.1 ABC transporter permease subunit [Armatimonadota bacterium]MDR7539210.1 ABC transporter permease subunit [Armatimonadota bacterium]